MSVLTALYPAGTVLLARYVLGERLSPVQRTGLGVAAFAAVLIAVVRQQRRPRRRRGGAARRPPGVRCRAMALPTPAADRTAIVTGASSGIGREIARLLARRGHGLTLVARRRERLQSLADELTGSSGIRVEVVTADLTDAGARTGVTTAVADAGLVPDVLVNAAGLSTVGPVHRNDPEAELAMIRTDVEAVAHLCSLVLPGMVERGGGAVLNVASTAAFQPMPGQAGYAASKAFVVSYSQALRGELRGTGVSVTALCPGPVETEFAEGGRLRPRRGRGRAPEVHVGLGRGRRGRGRRRPRPRSRRRDPRRRQPHRGDGRPPRPAVAARADARPPAPGAAELTTHTPHDSTTTEGVRCLLAAAVRSL